MGRPEINALQQHVQLLRVDLRARLFARSRLGKTVLLQALLPQTESRAVPVQRLQDPSLLVAEQEQRRLEYVGFHPLLDDECQAIDLFPHVEIVAQPHTR